MRSTPPPMIVPANTTASHTRRVRSRSRVSLMVDGSSMCRVIVPRTAYDKCRTSSERMCDIPPHAAPTASGHQSNRSRFMLPNPLHPAIVHFPVVLAFLLPAFAVGALVAIRRGAAPRRAWAIPLAVGLALAASAWVAVETGEAQDERVERVVAEQPLSAHEEMAETFLTASAGLALIAAAGL